MTPVNQEAKQFAVSVVSKLFQGMDQSAQRQVISRLRSNIPDIQLSDDQAPSQEVWTNTIAPKVVDFYARSYQSEGLRNTA